MTSRKEALISTIRGFLRSRPGFEYCNYGDVSAYRADARRATRQRHDAEAMLGQIAWRDGITADSIMAQARDRLTITETSAGVFRANYCTGQYYPTEYRAGMADVLASTLWVYWRDSLPAGELMHNSETGETITRYNGLRAGDYLRTKAKQELGAALTRRYFN